MKVFIRLIGTIGTGIFVYFLPEMWWGTSWKDLIYIVSNRDASMKILTELSYLVQRFGLNSNNIHSWAIQRIFICIGIGIGILILLFLLTRSHKSKEQ